MIKACSSTIAILVLLLAGCSDGNPPPAFSTDEAREEPSAAPTTEVPREEPSAETVSYTVLSEETVPGIKRSLEIQLPNRVSEAELRAIALRLRDGSEKYDRTFIGYYLPDMSIGKGYWATTHFNPTLQVKILGTTVEENETLKDAAVEDGRDIVGVWLDSRPFFGSRITLFSEDDQLFMETVYKDGSERVVKLVESKSPLGRRFDKAAGGRGDYWVVTPRGALEIRDVEGVIATFQRLE